VILVIVMMVLLTANFCLSLGSGQLPTCVP
jgi:hypothetical protein